MPLANHKINYGDMTRLNASEGEQSICRVSFADLPPELRKMYGAGTAPLQWTVYCRATPTVYAAADAPVAQVMLRIVAGHGGVSLQRDVDGTVYSKTSVAGSYVDVRARFVDKNGVTISPSNAAFAGTTASVACYIAPGNDGETEPQLWWMPIVAAETLAVALKLPNASTLLTQQKLRRFRVTHDFDGELFVQTFDSVNAPVNTDIPYSSDQVITNGIHKLDLDFGHQGMSFSKGLWVSLSTTQDTLTYHAAGANKWRLQGQLYRLDSGDGTA